MVGVQTASGAVVSTTVTVNDAVLLLPDASVAVHVIVCVPSGKKPDPPSQVTVGEGSTRSLAVAAGTTTFAPPVVLPSTVKSAGSDRVGGVVSTTVIVNVPLLLLPDASVAVHVIVCGPPSAKNPESGVQLTDGAGSTTSVAEAPTGSAARFNPPVVLPSIVAFGGSVNTGGVVSTTVTVRPALLVLPDESVAVQVTAVAPREKKPAPGLQLIDGDGSTSSEAVHGRLPTFAPPVVSPSTVTSEHEIVGGVVSFTVIEIVCVAITLPPGSWNWTVQLTVPAKPEPGAVIVSVKLVDWPLVTVWDDGLKLRLNGPHPTGVGITVIGRLCSPARIAFAT